MRDNDSVILESLYRSILLNEDSEPDDLDKKYLELTKNPEENKEKLQEMIDMTAKNSGFFTKVWHASSGKSVAALDNKPIYVAREKEIAEWATNKRAMLLYTNLSDKEIKRFPKWKLSLKGGQSELSEKLISKGFAAAESIMYPFTKRNKTEILLANPAGRLKSADPVTYNDQGNVIPLSQRFDSSKGDIRY